MSQTRIAGILFCVVAVACGRGPKADSAAVSAAPVADSSGSSGSSPAKAAVTNTIDPCTLITKAEAEAALGMSVTGPETERDGDGVTCTYTHSATTLVVHVGRQPSSVSAIEQARTLYGENAKILSGIGDAAFEGPGRMISGVKNSTLFLINTGAGPGIMSEDKFLALARTVAARL
ncbi:MAG: DUF3558 family protein [Acidobacteriota bacterium]